MTKILRNSSGNVLLQILVVSAVMGTSFYYLTDYVLQQKTQVAKNANLVNLRFALHSAMDYVIFGLRQKYCFTDDDILLNDTPDKCNLMHTGSVERLLMSPYQENLIRQQIVAGVNVGPVDVSAISLKEVIRYVKVSAASVDHPLFPVLQSLRLVRGNDGKLFQVDGIRVTMKRDESPYLPTAGQEAYLKVTVDLLSEKTGAPLELGAAKLTLSSQLTIYPREVGSFALLIPNDLHLDKQWDEVMPAGDVALHEFTSASELGTSTGLVFQSPVFVNRSLHIPYVDTSSVSSPSKYSAVTFADRVYLGNGSIKANGVSYAPASVGGLKDRYWTDARTFGGFLKGLENDGGLDKGLSVFKNGPGSISSGLASNMDLMKQCIEHTQMRASKDRLYKSEAAAVISMASPSKSKKKEGHDYRLFLTQGNEFRRQSNALLINKFFWADGKIALDEAVRLKGGGVVLVKFKLGDRFVEFQLPTEGEAVLTAPVGSKAYRFKLETAISSAEVVQINAEKTYNALKKSLANFEDDLDDLKGKLAAEMAKPPKPAKKEDEVFGVKYRDEGYVDSLNGQISVVNGKISSLKTDKIPEQISVLSAANAALDTANANYSNYKDAVANPPEIKVSTATSIGKKGYVSPDKLDISFEFENIKGLLDSDGDLVSPSVSIQIYDGSFYKSFPIIFPANSKLMTYLDFSFNAAKTELVAPSISALSPMGMASTAKESSIDYGALEAECEAARNAQTSQSFGNVGWNTDFSGATRLSWNFAGGSTLGKDPLLETLVLSNMTPANATFQVRSIVGNCIIEPTATFVTGFFACDHLEIQARTLPLRIIGTFIVGNMKIHPTAFKAGINWSSVYAPQATSELRAAKILKSFSGRSCDLKSADPIWHPIPSIKEVADRMGCNAVSLRAKADPFQWTSVDPDCGVMSAVASSNTTCKRRLVRFFVVEQSREGAL